MEHSVAVVYRSKGGSTQKYAQWLARELGADLREEHALKKGELARYQTLVYGGGVYAGGINGFKSFLRKAGSMANQRLAVFAVGLAPARPDIVRQIEQRAFPQGQGEGQTFFLLQGDFDYNKLGLIDRWMMNVLRAFIKSKKQPTSDERGMLGIYERPQVLSDKKYIAPIVEWVKRQA